MGKLDHVIAGSCQIVRPPRNNEAQATSCQLVHFSGALGARMARTGIGSRSRGICLQGYQILNLDVRATQDRAIRAFEARGYQHFGTNPHYAMVGRIVPGHFTKN